MINHQDFLDKTNYNDIWLRNVLVGFLAYCKGKVNWVNNFEAGPVLVNVPFHGTFGDRQFAMDAFVDDMPVDRINGNVDVIPRGAVNLQTWGFKSDEFTNPNIWINQQIEVDEDLVEIVAQVKMMPIKITAHIDIIVDSEGDVMKAWQSLMTSFFMYKYFTYTHERLPINAVFNIPTEMENPIVRKKTFGTKDAMEIPIDIEIHTVFPILDYTNKISANKQVEWILQMWMQNQIISRERYVEVPEGGLGPM